MATITTLLPAGTVRLLTHFLLDPEARLHIRALHKRTGLGMGALQRELARLSDLGLLRRTADRGRVYYEMAYEHPSWKALLTLFREHADPAQVIGAAMQDVPGIMAAFVFGSTARGEAGPDSDLDVLVIDDGSTRLATIGRAILQSESLLARPVDLKRYTPSSLAESLRDGNRFLKAVLSGPKAWILGSDATLKEFGAAT
jgi:predicted nucleotidyltransferase